MIPSTSRSRTPIISARACARSAASETYKAIRHDLARFARGVHPRVLLDAASRFGQFTGPVRILWGDNDAYFGIDLGRQLSEAFSSASLTIVPGGRTFLPLDHPGEVAGEILAAVREGSSRPR